MLMCHAFLFDDVEQPDRPLRQEMIDLNSEDVESFDANLVQILCLPL